MRTPVYILALVAAAGLGACGGGGSFELPAPAAREVPASALASPEAFSRYVGSIAPDDTAEPLPRHSMSVVDSIRWDPPSGLPR